MDSPVIIVGTHYDLLSSEERKSDHMARLRQMIRERYMAYEFGGGLQSPRERGLPRVMATIEVSCKTGHNIKELRQLIYNKAFEIKEKGKAQFKRRAILVSNLIVFKLDCRTTVDSNVEFNLVVPDSAD